MKKFINRKILTKERIFLLLLVLVFVFPIKSFSVSSLITFPDKIDTLQERKNIQIVLNRVIVPSLNLVVDGVIGRGTIRAIQVFQELKGLVPDGKVGPMTRLALENAQNISSIPGCAPGALFSTLNGQPCSGGNLPAGCLSSSGFSTITGLPCGGVPDTNLPVGCLSSSGYSTITGLSCGVNTPIYTGGSGGGGGGGSHNGGGNNVIIPKYLVEDNIGYAEIIISPTAPNMVEIAANDLQLYIQKMTGVTLPIATTINEAVTYHIYVGQSVYTDALGINDDDCEFDSFKMISGDNYLVLLGNDDIINTPQPYTKRWSSEGATVRAAWDVITGHTWETPYILYLKNYNPAFDIWEGDGRGSINAVYKFLYNQGVRWYYPGDIGEVVPTKNDILLPTVNTHIRPDFNMRHMFMYNKEFIDETTVASAYYIKWQLRLGLNSGEDSLGISRGHGINNITSRSETKIAHPEYYAIWGGIRQNGADQKQDLCSSGLLAENIDFVKTMFAHYNSPSENVMPADGFIHASESSQECINKETASRGYEGQISDYVFEYVNNVAKEVYKTYPNKNIATSAYTAYLLPPLYINQFSPNVSVTLSKWRSHLADPEQKEFYRDLANDWLAKLPSGRIYTYDYYLHNMPERQNSSVPYYFPHIISDDLKFLKGKSSGEFIEVSTNLLSANLGWDTFAAQALNVYVTAQLYWDADQNIDSLLNEYYTLYYGPASSKMKTLVEYSEANYINAPEDPTILVHLRQLATEAKAIAGNTIYGQRVDLVLGLINSRYEGSDVIVNSCQTLNSPTTTYKLNTDVSSSGTCFNITDDDITLDCQGHTITYGTTGGVNNHGINIDTQGLFNLKNCVIQNGNSSSGYGIRVNNSETGGLIKDNNINISSNTFAIYIMGSKNVDLENNIITSPATGVQFYGSSNGNIINNQISGNSNTGLYLYSATDNILSNNTISSVSGYGIEFLQSDNNTLTNNNVSSASSLGFWLYQSSDNIFSDNSFSSVSSTGIRLYDNANNNSFTNQTAIGGTNGFEIVTSNNNLIKNCTNISGTTRDVYIHSYSSALNNIFLSCIYDVELLDQSVDQLIRKWYVDVTVSNSSGAKISGATVNSYDSTGALEATSVTDASGNARLELTEYIRNGATKTTKTPHTITVSKSDYNSNSTVLNLTQTHSTEQNVTLSSGVLGVSTYYFTEKLELGSIGNEVKELQNYLINKGYLNTSVTGYFGSKTFEALKEYQKANNLEADGLVGAKTREVLNK